MCLGLWDRDRRGGTGLVAVIVRCVDGGTARREGEDESTRSVIAFDR